MLLIYTPKINPRIEYAAEVCFKHAFKLDYRITNDLREFEKSADPCFWYAPSKVSGKPGVICDAMMIDCKIMIPSPGRAILGDTIVLFPTESILLPKFDLFAAVLWHVSRMEEYNYNVKDATHRFTSEMSIARKIGILHKPAVNIWTEMFLSELKLLYPDLVFEKPVFKYIPTVDVDSIFLYKAKGIFRATGGVIRDVFRKKFADVKKRLRVIRGKDEDPWFCFDKINLMHEEYGISPYYFFLVGKFGNLDRNISPTRKQVKTLVRGLAKDYTIGVHNSYRGNFSSNVWSKELRLLQKLSRSDIFSSRQHYLFVRFPSTYKDLQKIGIKRDFSMVYPDMSGFRMGITVPVPFFDLHENRKTELWLYPTMIVDVGLQKYQALSIEEAIAQSLDIVEYTKKYGGTLITLWHNESLSEYGKWEGWNKVYYEIIKAATTE